MSRITPKPTIDVVSVVPEVASRARTTVRLHPQSGKVRDAAASKLGGEILWPAGEAWPVCTAKPHKKSKQPPFVAALQLRKEDVPELGFPQGKDLFQLLWCPSMDHPDDDYVPIPRVYWRNTADICEPAKNPKPEHCEHDCVPEPCRVTMERVVEYPDIGSLDMECLERLDEDLSGVYQFELSTCPGTKVGGYPSWVQDPMTIQCERGHDMDFLLQMTDSEYTNVETYQRWIPEEDRWIAKSRSQKAKRVNNPANFHIGHSVLYLFICRECSDWPVLMTSQR